MQHNRWKRHLTLAAGLTLILGVAHETASAEGRRGSKEKSKTSNGQNLNGTDISSLLAQPTPKPDNPGSLWQETAYRTYLDYDRTAHTMGDLVTIHIQEETQASRSATTNLSRQGEVNAGVSAAFGLETKLANIAPDVSPTAGLGTDSSSAFSGEGATSRSGSLKATVTARVVGVLANGNLIVDGRQQVKVNNEVQYLSIRGIVRPQDIRIDNTILSSFVADAQIEYSGAGVIAEKQTPGWGSRVVDKVWPF